MAVERRKRGPDVWCFRWREAGPDGRKIHRRIVLGTADELRSIPSARKMVVGLRREININDVRIRRESIKLADLSRHFQQRHLNGARAKLQESLNTSAFSRYLSGETSHSRTRSLKVAGPGCECNRLVTAVSRR